MPKNVPPTKKTKNLHEVPPPPPPHRGSAVSTAKFTEDDVRLIRKMFAKGWTISGLATKYGVTWVTMSRIVKRESWAHVQDE